MNAGTRLGPYEIVSALGAGGMGEVYRARDTRLDREVAIKILPDSMTRNADRIARFEREAKVLASLNHSNIGAIHGFETVEARKFLVLEYVEGETLAHRLKAGALPVDEALAVSKQMAEALEAAHEKGIVHRDLKPGNVMIRPDGTVKVLDFGLARAMTDDSTSVAAMPDSPTVTSPDRVVSPTIPGVIMGTAGYMSPEQARGKAVDTRSDIFSFGCVLFEMLTGAQPFMGETVTDSLGAVLHREPDWTLLPSSTPRRIHELLSVCLAKDRKNRLRDIGDARLAIENANGGSIVAPPTRSGARPAVLSAIALVTLGAGTIAGLWIGGHTHRSSAREITRLDMGLEPAEMLGPVIKGLNRPVQPSFVLTPDGRQIIFAGNVGATTQLFVRSLDAAEAVPLAGTSGASSPFLSPRGDWVGFLADGEIRKTPIAGGPVVKIARLIDGGLASASPHVPAEKDFFGAAWGEDDAIVFGRFAEGLWQVSASGGVPKHFTAAKDQVQRLPHYLPDRRGILVTIGLKAEMGIAVIPPSGGEPKILIEHASDARFVGPGNLVFARDGMLMAAPFDLSKLDVTGPPVAIVSNVLHALDGPRPAANVGTAFFDVSTSGTLVFAVGGMYPVEPSRLVWVSRDGTSQPVGIPDGYLARPRLAPDGRRLVVSYVQASGKYIDNSLHIFDLDRGTLSRLTDREVGWGPLWSRDGSQVFFEGDAKGSGSLVSGLLSSIAVDGSAPVMEIAKGQTRLLASSELPDKSYIVVIGGTGETGSDIVLMSPTGELHPWLNTKANEAWAEISPDGKTMAYGSDASGQFEVYAQPFPGPGSRQQVSIDGGHSPLWSHRGKELFFFHPVVTKEARLEELCVVDFTSESLLAVGKPRALFSGQYGRLGSLTNYDISLDDQRFLMTEHLTVPDASVARLHVVLNWSEELRRLSSPGAKR